MIKHILFDLDGTLLPMVQDEFVEHYFGLLAKKFAPVINPKILIDAMWKGVEAMLKNDGSRTNEEAFWNCFGKLIPLSREKMEAELQEFYTVDFNEVIASTHPSPHAPEIVSKLKNIERNVYLATNPIFPRCATLSRIRWAGLSAEDFEEITTYETCRYSKPNVLYFQDLLEKYHLNPEECLMIGNDPADDLVIRQLGVKTYLVTDYIENRQHLPLESDYLGSLEELKNTILTII